MASHATSPRRSGNRAREDAENASAKRERREACDDVGAGGVLRHVPGGRLRRHRAWGRNASVVPGENVPLHAAPLYFEGTRRPHMPLTSDHALRAADDRTEYGAARRRPRQTKRLLLRGTRETPIVLGDRLFEARRRLRRRFRAHGRAFRAVRARLQPKLELL